MLDGPDAVQRHASRTGDRTARLYGQPWDSEPVGRGAAGNRRGYHPRVLVDGHGPVALVVGDTQPPAQVQLLELDAVFVLAVGEEGQHPSRSYLEACGY